MLTYFTKLAAEIFRDYETDGVPATGAHKLIKQDIRDYLAQVESVIGAAILISDPPQDPTVAPLAWAQFARYRSTFTTAI